MQTPESIPALPELTPTPPRWWQRSFEDLVMSIPYRRLFRHLLAGNPFYLISAVMMLYGIYLVSLDPQILHTEYAELAFNFSSLQLYELLLVIVAIFLIKRSIWYDGTLLVGLENLFLFVPFILISQASMLDHRAAWLVCLAGTALLCLRTGLLKRHITSLNLPKAFLFIGASLLVLNVALPLYYRHIIGISSLRWGEQRLWLWLGVLPLILASVNLAPIARRTEGPLPSRHWLPSGLLLLWMLVTVSHIAAVDYLDNLHFHWAEMAPLIWVGTWTLYQRRESLLDQWSAATDRVLLFFPFTVPFLALHRPTENIALALAALNAVLYGALVFRGRHARFTQHLAAFSLVTLVYVLPERFGRVWMAEFTHTRALALAAAAYALFLSLRSRRPQLAIVGAVICGLGTVNIFSHLDYIEEFAQQNALLFALLHSIRWDRKARGGDALKTTIVTAWVLHSYGWLHYAGWVAAPGIALSCLLPLTMYLYLRVHRRGAAPVSLVLGSLLTFITLPVYLAVEALKIMPVGHLTVLGSFLFFAAGTALALTKPLWLPRLTAVQPPPLPVIPPKVETA